MRSVNRPLYNVVDYARLRTADNLWVNHGSVAIVAGAHIALSPVGISDNRPFEFVCARARVGCDRRPAVPARLAAGAAAAAADVHWRTDARALNLTLRLCIVSYCIAIFCVISIVSYRFPLRPYRANTRRN